MRRVLIVDDNRAIRELLRSWLELEDYCVATAEDGVQAVVFLVRAAEPWVVLMDVQMPRMGGIEACRELIARGGETCARHRIALMSAGCCDDLELPRPVRLLMRKPFDLEQVQCVVETLQRELEAEPGEQAARVHLPACPPELDTQPAA
jgi:CheY-like chemotaxis protein